MCARSNKYKLPSLLNNSNPEGVTMSDRIYTNEEHVANHNFVTVAQACHGVLTKVNHIDGSQTAFGNVKYYNFFEEEISDLGGLYRLHQKLLWKDRCCILRCRIKDKDNRRGVVRKSNGDDATLIAGKFNWFAIDIDKFGEGVGDLQADACKVILALPSVFWDSECFAVATSSYQRKEKPGINLRLFFWADKPVTNLDLKKALSGTIVDLAIYANPVQPIYTAAPKFDDGIDPIDVRIVWIQRAFQTVVIKISEDTGKRGAPEIQYTKQQANKFVEKIHSEIRNLSMGERHDGLIRWCYFLGKLIGDGHFEREDSIERVISDCSFWSYPNEKKDRETATYAIDRGIASMQGT